MEARTRTDRKAWGCLVSCLGILLVGVSPAPADDCNGNGIPDECDLTCVGDCDVYPGCGQGLDCQPDGIPDECQLGQMVDLFYDHSFAQIAWRADERAEAIAVLESVPQEHPQRVRPHGRMNEVTETKEQPAGGREAPALLVGD